MIAASHALPKPPGLHDFPRPFTFGGHQAEKITIPIPAWRQAFTLLGACPGRPGADTTSAPGIVNLRAAAGSRAWAEMASGQACARRAAI